MNIWSSIIYTQKINSNPWFYLFYLLALWDQLSLDHLLIGTLLLYSSSDVWMKCTAISRYLLCFLHILRQGT